MDANATEIFVRVQLEMRFPNDVYSTEELQEHFDVIGFLAPFVVVERKTDRKKGSLEFTQSPRFYFNFIEDEQKH